jgi:hypothetical protein
MPSDPSKRVDRFLRKLLRRKWGLRIAEGAGTGVAIAAAGGMALVAVIYPRHQSAEAAVEGLIVLGLAVGAAVGMARRPKTLLVATEADRQLHLPELLSSAAMLPVAGATDAVDRAMRQLLAERAAEQCGTKPARRIRLRRWGINRWTAIALAAGVALLLGTLTSPHAPPAPAADDANRSVAVAGSDDAPLVTLEDSPASRHIEMNPDEPVNGGQPLGSFANVSEPPSTPPAGGGDHSPPSPTGEHSGNGNGSGSAHSTVDQSPAFTSPEISPLASSSGGSGVNGGGAGPAAMAPSGHDAGAGGGAGRTVDSDHAPPWQSIGWAAEAEAARRQVDAGQIPAAYRDLVRDYFAPSAD